MRLLCAILLVLVMVVCAPVSASESSAPARIVIKPDTDPIEIVRCHFEEGRIVIRQTDRLFVLHEGDVLEGTGTKVTSITPDSATLLIRPPDSDEHFRIIRVTTGDNRVVRLREYSTDPHTHSAGASAPSAPVAATTSASDTTRDIGN